MSLGYPNQNGGRTTDAALFHSLGNIFTGTWVSGFKVRQNSPLGMSVRIGGESDIPDDLLVRDAADAVFPVCNLSSQPVVAAVSTANSANPRIDTVVVYIDASVAANHTAANNENRTKIAVVAGTPATSPSAPSASQIKSVIGSNSPYTVLADIRVNRGATSISDANITDRRWAVKLRHAPIIDNTWQLKNDIVLPRHLKFSELVPLHKNVQRIDGFSALHGYQKTPLSQYSATFATVVGAKYEVIAHTEYLNYGDDTNGELDFQLEVSGGVIAKNTMTGHPLIQSARTLVGEFTARSTTTRLDAFIVSSGARRISIYQGYLRVMRVE